MQITKEAATQILPYLSNLRQELHSYPELALKEFQTAQIIERELNVLRIKHQRIGKIGVLGLLRGEKTAVEGLPRIRTTIKLPFRVKWRNA